MKLYRYINLKSVKDVQYLIGAIEKNRFYLSSPFKFNDPYEFQLDIDFSVESEGDFKAWAIRTPLNDSEFREILKLRSNPNLQLRKRIDFINHIKSKYGVLCFSQSPSISLMWSYYAKDHTGVCLEIDFGKQIKGTTLQRVRYRKRIPSIRYFYGQEDGKWACFTKASIWKHEKEWRFIKIDCQGKIRFEQPVKVTGLYLGSRFSQNKYKDKTIRLIKKVKNIIPVYEMLLSPLEYSVAPKYLALSNEMQFG